MFNYIKAPCGGMRYFLIGFVASAPGGTLVNCTATSYRLFPTCDEAIAAVRIANPDALSIYVVSISEISKRDYKRIVEAA